jgi:Flp pilus assembly pilin Flp
MLRLAQIRKGQSTIEYAVLIALVAAAFIAMHTYLTRAAQSKLKQVEDEMNEPTVIVK